MKTNLSESEQKQACDLFCDLQGIGPNLAAHLWNIGLRSKVEIAKSDPEVLYARDCELSGQSLDRCVLYVYRCIVAACKHEQSIATVSESTVEAVAQLDPSQYKWWNWSDKNIRRRQHESEVNKNMNQK